MMLDGLHRWFDPPVFPNNLDKTRRAALLNALLLVNMTLLGTGIAVNAIFGVSLWVSAAEVVMIGALSLMRWLLYRGYVSLNSYVMLVLFSLGLTGLLAWLGNVDSPLLGGMLLIVVTAGMLLTWRGTLMIALLNAGLLAGLRIADYLQMLPPSNPSVDTSEWIFAFVILFYGAIFTHWTHRDIHQALDVARSELAERRRAEEALARSHEFLQGVVNALDDPVVVKDANHRYVIANEAACALLGTDRQAVTGRCDADFMPAEHASRYWEEDTRVLETGETLVVEETIVDPAKNRPVTISTKKARYVDPLTGERFVAAIVRDITDQKRIEDELRQARAGLEKEVASRTAELLETNTTLMNEVAERRIIEDALRTVQSELETLMNTVPGLVVMFNQDGKLIHWNRIYQETLGYDEEELRGMHGELTITPADRHLLAQAVETAIREGRAEMELRALTKDGREIPIYSTGARIIAKDGSYYVASIGLDISNLRATAEALRRSQQELQALMNAAPGIVFMFHEDGRIMRWNQRFEELSGYTADELRAMNVLEIIAADDHSRLDTNYRQLLTTGQTAAELTIITTNGEAVPILATGALIVDENNERYIAGTGVDITDLKAAQGALTQTQSRLRALLDATTDVAFLMSTDGTFLAVNDATTRLMGYSEGELMGKNGFDLLPPDLAAARRELFDEVLRTGRPARFQDLGLDGWSDNSMFPIFGPHGHVEAMAVFSRDINEQKRAEAALRESEERYALSARGANDGLWDADLITERMYLSPRFYAMLGEKEQEELSVPVDFFLNRLHPEDLDRFTNELESHLQGRTEHFESEYRILHTDGSYRWMLSRGLAVRNERGEPYRIAGSITDITERKRVEAKLLHDAFYDALTGLPNRALLTDRLEQVLRHRKRYPNEHFSVIYMDLDRFKDINDSLGHSIGDQLLVAVAKRMQNCLRGIDTLARLSGDEFVILLPECNDPADAIRVAERIQSQLTHPFELSGLQAITSASIGIVFADAEHERPEEILRDADIAMYRAKSSGRARYQVFNRSMHSQVLSRMRLETDLRRAIERQEFEVHYMPIVHLKAGSFAGFEALIRWRGSNGALTAPGEFIPLAEESGLIIPLDRFVLSAACRQVRAWQQQTGCPVELSINLSGKQFAQDDLIAHIQRVLRETSFDPTQLRVEITESAIMENIELATTMLRQLQSLGVKVEVDDFGTGYSSLTYLMQLPVSGLKIDRGFIRHLGIDLRRTEIVRTIITLAHNIGMSVVAEGIETESQLSSLREMGCDFAQGYLISHPLNETMAEGYVREAVARQ